MIHKQVVEKNGSAVVRVTFTLPSTLNADKIYLVGDFNQWNATSHPFARDGQGNWFYVLHLEHGRAFQFRYLSDGHHWMNDSDADDYVANVHGGSNFVVVTHLD